MAVSRAFIYLVAAFSLTSDSVSSFCNHAKIAKKITPNKMLQEQSHRLLQSDSEWRSIRIEVDYSNIVDINPIYFEYFKYILMPEALKMLEGLIQVRGPRLIPKFNSTACDYFGIASNEKYSNSNTEADLIILFTVSNENESYLAQATACSVSDWDNRPIVGWIDFNLRNLVFGRNSIRPALQTLLHEFFHVLAFSPNLYPYFPKEPSQVFSVAYPDEKRREEDLIFKIVTPGLLETARKHFNCSKIDGIPMENEGGGSSAGSHFEKLFFGNEMMTGHDQGFSMISKFSLAFLNDVGWYIVDIDKAEPYFWGEGAGCALFEKQCDPSLDIICPNEGEISCSPDFMSKSICAVRTFTNNCKIKEYPFGGVCTTADSLVKFFEFEQGGANSRCFRIKRDENDDQLIAGCFVSYCFVDRIELLIGNNTYLCRNENDEIRINNTTIFCPNREKFCKNREITDRCGNDCSGRGVCTARGICNCDVFYRGEVCGVENPCGENTTSVCQYAKAIRNVDRLSFHLYDSGTTVLNKVAVIFLVILCFY